MVRMAFGAGKGLDKIMHELGVVLGMFDMLESIMKEQELKEISKVNVTVGELCGILPDYFEECWKVARLGGTFDKTELVIRKVPAVAKCTCGKEYEMLKNSRICPVCQKTDYEIIGGKEFEIDSIEAC